MDGILSGRNVNVMVFWDGYNIWTDFITRETEDEGEYSGFDEESSSLIKLNNQYVLYLLQVS